MNNMACVNPEPEPVKKKVDMIFPEITELENESGEKIKLRNPITMASTLDVWCRKLEVEMVKSVNLSCQKALAEIDEDNFIDNIWKYPTQMLLVAMDAKMNRALDECLGNDTAMVCT